jgi:peptidoglycan/LPS O-acetylase OafA/YrhL
MGIAYQREVDGLRAVAVAAVVLSHAGLGPPAGFVGVDVFFVISGYLITSLLLREYETSGRLDLLAFYARRVRRIFPAAIVVVVFTLAAGSALLSSDEFHSLAQSAASALVFCANLFFQQSADGYFQPDATRMPLLHLWSLSVEEQFYLAWPVLLLLLLRMRLRMVPTLIVVAILSLGLSEWLMRWDTDAAFFQTPARFWELTAGGLIAVAPARRWGVAAGWIGTAVVVAATFLKWQHFPGLGAMPAVLGTALVLAALKGGAGNPLLASRPMVGLGLVSYSLYLWHWPLLALYHSTVIGEGTLPARWGLCATALGLALASYRYVEQPIRKGRWPAGATVAWGALTCLALATGVAVYESSDRKPTQLAESTPASRAAADADVAFLQRCEYRLMEPLSDFPKVDCPPDAKARLVIWGDSMAGAWEPMVAARDRHASAFVRSGCPPVVGYAVRFRARVIADLCAGFNAHVAAKARGDTLILAARWQAYEELEPALRATLVQVSPRFRRVVLMGITPELKSPAPRCLELHQDRACSYSRADFEATTKTLGSSLKAIALEFPNVTYLDPEGFFCVGNACPVSRDGYSLYTDAYHVSATAARAFGASLGDKL